MQRSFSIVNDEEMDEDSDEEQMRKKYGSALSRRSPQTNLDTDKHLSKIPSAGPSGLPTVKNRSSDDSDSDEDTSKPNAIPGEYDPKQYENLEVGAEIQEIFQYIGKYTPQDMSLDHRFKPFVPEFIPAVGDIDAFLKVLPPSDDTRTANQRLGLAVLDEPAANQSDAALLHLQLRAESVNTARDSDVVVKRVNDVEKNAKVVDKWIKDVSALHKSKTFPAVRYTETMPDLDELMQEWPEEMEKQLKERGFPEPGADLGMYIDEVCSLFQIPSKNKIQALHLLFSLYAAVKGSQLYKSSNLTKEEEGSNEGTTTNVADQLVLE